MCTPSLRKNKSGNRVYTYCYPQPEKWKVQMHNSAYLLLKYTGVCRVTSQIVTVPKPNISVSSATVKFWPDLGILALIGKLSSEKVHFCTLAQLDLSHLKYTVSRVAHRMVGKNVQHPVSCAVQSEKNLSGAIIEPPRAFVRLSRNQVFVTWCKGGMSVPAKLTSPGYWHTSLVVYFSPTV